MIAILTKTERQVLWYTIVGSVSRYSVVKNQCNNTQFKNMPSVIYHVKNVNDSGWNSYIDILFTEF